ncbi:glycosyltransferase family 117 protein [Trichlorobacter ammonificans]|uniref:DUF2723 domain-containing protein n=1 Tax=Trichlorobacter ammonificans TaxID=2916410 RepID=A0ABM9DAX6_9BACT|nr:DUF2723 domain-containing protein [Trichlorobacter ammonificans]CAH2031535.1 conserved membrane protein of unknown function [Trichlorobacter ammonificans]
MKLLRDAYPDPWALAAFLLPFALYLATLAPSVTFYDSGEFMTATWYLGSAHSPGYPLFLLYLKPFTWLPLGSIAFRINLATALSAALACLGCYHLTLALLKGRSFGANEAFTAFAIRMAALAGALILATSPRLWLQSNHDKPYPLLAFITAVMFLLLLKWRERLRAGSEQPAWWYAVAFLAGLASGAHQTVVLLLPGMLLFVLMSAPAAVRRVREWLLAAACLLAGGAVQLYLPLRAAAGALQSWGDTSSLSRFLWHILRKGYPEEPHNRDLALLVKQLGAFDIPHEFGWVGLGLLGIGIWSCRRVERAFLAAFLAAVACFWLVIAGHFNPRLESIFLTEEFYTPLYLLSAVMVALGLFEFVACGVQRAATPQSYDYRHRLLLPFVFLLLPLFQLGLNFSSQDQHDNYLAHDYALNTLRTLPENGVLFTWGDSGAFPLWYLHGVERMRQDVDLPHIPHLTFSWHRRELPRLKPYLDAGPTTGAPAETVFRSLAVNLANERPVLVDFSSRYSLEWAGTQPVQQGIVFGLTTGDLVTALEEPQIWDHYILHRLIPERWQPDEDSRKALIIHAYCLMQSAEDLARRGHVREASRLLERSEAIMPAWQENLRQLAARYGIPAKKTEEKP